MNKYEEAAMNALVELMAGEAEKKTLLSLNPIHSKIYDGKYSTVVDGIKMVVSYETDASNVFHVRKADEDPHDTHRIYFNDKEMFVREMN